VQLAVLVINIYVIYLSVHVLLYSPCGPWSLFQSLNPYTVSRTPWTGDQPVTRPPFTHRTTQTQNKGAQTKIPRVGFEPTTPAFERATAVIGFMYFDGVKTKLKSVVCLIKPYSMKTYREVEVQLCA
jgi:hypothetical protein